MISARACLAALCLLAAPVAQAQEGVSVGTIEAQPLPSFDPNVEGSLGLENMADTAADPFADQGGFVDAETGTVLMDEEIIVLGAPKVVAVATGPGAILRGLDKVSGETTDFELAPGERAALGRLSFEMAECRYPTDNPAGDAFAYLTIDAEGVGRQFEGWMIASSPALSALDHPRYDLWVIRCKTS